MLSGKGDFRCGDEVSTITAGDLIQIDSNVPHTFDAVYEDAQWLEFFTPNREDYKPE
jgi:quercetin dioxygenase-like cupin family protein